jgi:hypothetical protein
MGGIASSLLKPNTLTGKQFSNNKEIKKINEMSNALFTYMYDSHTIDDIFDIADNPGEYVIAISDLITAQFDVIGYTTAKGKFGEIYFKKWEKLDPPKTQGELQKVMSGSNATRKKRIEDLIRTSESSRQSSKQLQHARNANIIAFYFVRIFQILGSMLLVVKDTEFPELNIIRGNRQANASRAYAGQAQSVITGFNPPRAIAKNTQFGGGISNFPRLEPLGPFEFLRKYLKIYDEEYRREFKENYNVDIPSSTEGYYKFDYSNNLFLKVTKPSPLPTAVGAKMPGSKQEFCLLVKNRNGIVEQKLIDVNVVEFRSISGPVLNEYKAPAEFDISKQGDRYPTSVVIATKYNNTEFYAQFQPSERPSSSGNPSGLKYILIPYSPKPNNDLYEALNNEFDVEKQFVRILEEYVIKTMNRSNTFAGQGYSRFIPETIESAEKSDGKKKRLKGPEKHKGLMATFSEMSSEKHTPHCISRAIQLLDAASINDEKREVKAGQTRICTSKGKGTSYQPLKSIGQLFGKLKVKSLIVDGDEFKKAETVLKAFVGKDSQSMPLTVQELSGINQEDEAAEMKEAIRRLVEAFNMNNKLVSEIKSFDDINLDAPSACSRPGISSDVTKGRPEFIEMQRHAQRLLAAHLNNVIGITEFLKTIFNISQRPDGSWKVDGPNTDLLFAGYDTLDEITKQARGLLVNYYSECETIYQAGVKKWVESLPSITVLPGQRVLAQPVAGAPPASAPRASAPPASAPRANAISNNNPTPIPQTPNTSNASDPRRH